MKEFVRKKRYMQAGVGYRGSLEDDKGWPLSSDLWMAIAMLGAPDQNHRDKLYSGHSVQALFSYNFFLCLLFSAPRHGWTHPRMSTQRLLLWTLLAK